MKDNSNAPPMQPKKVKAPKHSKHHTTKHKVHHKEPQKLPEQEPTAITPQAQEQWSIFGESAPMVSQSANMPTEVQPEQQQIAVPEQFAPPADMESPISKAQTDDVTPSQYEFPGLRPLNSELVKHLHDKKPQLPVNPPASQEQSSLLTQQPSLPPPPTAAVADAPLPSPPAPPTSALPLQSSPSPQSLFPNQDSQSQDSSNQAFPSIPPNAPIVPVAPQPYYLPDFVPLQTIPLPVFLQGNYLNFTR